MACRAFMFLVLSVSPHIVIAQYNPASNTNNVMCVYPISGAYGLLNRVLLYVLWFVASSFTFTFLPFISYAALAWVMAYTATSSLHALMLAATSSSSQFDLDAVGTWAVLSVSAVWMSAIVWHSSRLRNTPYKPIFLTWATIVTIGTICAAVSVFIHPPVEPQCTSQDAECSYTCVHTKRLLRDSADIRMIPASRIFEGPLHALLIASVALAICVGLLYGYLPCIFGIPVARKRTFAELRDALDPPQPKSTTPKAQQRWKKTRQRAWDEMNSGICKPRKRSYRLLLVVLVYFIVIGFNEAYIMSTIPLPASEGLYAIGQWGSWVAAACVLIAAVANLQYADRWHFSKRVLDSERDRFNGDHVLAEEMERQDRLETMRKGQSVPADVENQSNLETPRIPPPVLRRSSAASSSAPTLRGSTGFDLTVHDPEREEEPNRE